MHLHAVARAIYTGVDAATDLVCVAAVEAAFDALCASLSVSSARCPVAFSVDLASKLTPYVCWHFSPTHR